MSDDVANLSSALTKAILPEFDGTIEEGVEGQAFSIIQSHFYPELLDAITKRIHSLIYDDGVQPGEIVVLAPYLSDALRFSITNRFDVEDKEKNKKKIPWRSHRPSRSLRDEPASHALITLAALAHPHWSIHPPKFDVAYALMQSIEGLDLVRSQLLTEIIYRQRDLQLSNFDQINPDVQERITFSVGNRYTILRDWLLAYREDDQLPLDHFLRKLFGEVISQPGYGFYANLEGLHISKEEKEKNKKIKYDAVRVAGSLIESVKKFRLTMESTLARSNQIGFDYGREYIAMLTDGVISAIYPGVWQITKIEDTVLIAPAHTFLMMNRPVTVQFWLDIGSGGWYERLSQPLTHPHVLSRGWEPGRQWSDADEVQASQEALARLTSGLLHRCREHIYICLSELGESGFEQRGDLLRAFQKVLQGQES